MLRVGLERSPRIIGCGLLVALLGCVTDTAAPLAEPDTGLSRCEPDQSEVSSPDSTLGSVAAPSSVADARVAACVCPQPDASAASKPTCAPFPNVTDVERDVDMYVLSRNIEQLASLTVLKNGEQVFKRSRADILAFVPTAGRFHLTSGELEKHWLNTFWAWIYQTSQTPHADAQRIMQGLGHYFVGLHKVSVGPECSPISGGYEYGFLTSGAPGDDTATRVEAEVVRSEAHIASEIQQVPTSCITAIRPSPTGSEVLQDVTIDLPVDPATALDDTRIYGNSPSERIGVPVPRPTPLHKSASLK